MSLRLRALLAWVVLAAVMFGNGALRVLLLEPRLGEHVARQVATGSGVAIVAGFAWLFVRRLDERVTVAELWRVGALWLALTLLFELGLGLVAGSSWEAILADYDVLSGRLWPLVPLTALLAPPFWGGVRTA